MNVIELRYTTIHEVDEPTRGSYDKLYAPTQGSDLLFDAGTAIDCLYVDAVNILGEVAKVISNLQTQLSGWS